MWSWFSVALFSLKSSNKNSVSSINFSFRRVSSSVHWYYGNWSCSSWICYGLFPPIQKEESGWFYMKVNELFTWLLKLRSDELPMTHELSAILILESARGFWAVISRYGYTKCRISGAYFYGPSIIVLCIFVIASTNFSGSKCGFCFKLLYSKIMSSLLLM